MYLLRNEIYFPPLHTTHPSGIIAIGGDLSVERLLLAYRSGIFPWFEDGEPITWWSPPERMVCFPDQYKPSKSLRNILNRKIFDISYNTHFEQVIKNCQKVSRTGQNGTWITDEMADAYLELHKMGHAKSVEVWQNDELVGGLYGIDLGNMFCGESMFSLVPNASKVAFHYLVELTKQWNYHIIDGQIYNAYLAQLGFIEIGREEFAQFLPIID